MTLTQAAETSELFQSIRRPKPSFSELFAFVFANSFSSLLLQREQCVLLTAMIVERLFLIQNT